MSETGAASRRGLMLVLSSPSGAGKSTLSRLLLERNEQLILSVSVTTRQRRPSEVDGVHYTFIDRDSFIGLRDSGALLEWAEVHSNLYATPRAAVARALAGGQDVLFDIDWQGARQLKAAMPEDVVGIFILPPSMAELRARLERRAQDDPEVIARRLANARDEIEHWREYDYVIVNEDLDATYNIAQSILEAERLKRSGQAAVADPAIERFRRDSQPELPAFVASLLSS